MHAMSAKRMFELFDFSLSFGRDAFSSATACDTMAKQMDAATAQITNGLITIFPCN
jgi:hypothetical protein